MGNSNYGTFQKGGRFVVRDKRTGEDFPTLYPSISAAFLAAQQLDALDALDEAAETCASIAKQLAQPTVSLEKARQLCNQQRQGTYKGSK